MKFRKLLLIPLMFALSTAVSANGFYLGTKVGIMDADLNAFDPATNGGFLLGYEFRKNLFAWGPEAEFTFSISDGDFGFSGHWDITTQAAYGFFKFGDPAYVKVKAGVLHEKVSVSGFGSASESDTGGSAGIGGGWRVTDHFAIEAEATLIEQDVMFYSLGVNYHF